VEEYGLSKGPQTEAFGRRLLFKGDDEEGSSSDQPGPTDDELDKLGYTNEGDRELIESIVTFTRLLLENCGNRNLYASSSRLNSLLNTTSLSLLKATLRLTLRLAQRYHATRTRMQSNSLQNPILASHYALSLDNLYHMASTFPKGISTLPPAPQ
jgi:E3 ubiquitin-protein ligase HUWE1